MLKFIFIITLIISAASATLGILLSVRLRKKHPELNIFTTLVYQQIFIYIFAFYSIWGHILFKLVFSTEILSTALMEKIGTVQILTTLPFQGFSWWFLLLLMVELFQMRRPKTLATFLTLCLIGLVIPVYFIFFKTTEGFNQTVFPLFCIENSMVYAVLIVLPLLFKSKLISTKNRVLTSTLIAAVGIMVALVTLYYTKHILLSVLFILTFFIANLWPVFVFTRMVKIKEEKSLTPESENFESICLHYEISKREADIIECICKGLTNQEIADQLFISLQTVKDHCSRIYLKTDVKNRTQLANLFRI